VADNRVPVGSLLDQKPPTIYADNGLDIALELMLKSGDNILTVVNRDTKQMVGAITEWDILKVFEKRFIEDKHITQHISIKKNALNILKKAKTKI
jgi:predicted transcriptional regulator